MRKMKIRENVWANASALTVAFVYIACALLVGLFPEVSKLVAVSWFHGMDLGIIWTGGSRGNFIVGLVTATGGGWIVGFIFAWFYNKLNK